MPREIFDHVHKQTCNITESKTLDRSQSFFRTVEVPFHEQSYNNVSDIFKTLNLFVLYFC